MFQTFLAVSCDSYKPMFQTVLALQDLQFSRVYSPERSSSDILCSSHGNLFQIVLPLPDLQFPRAYVSVRSSTVRLAVLTASAPERSSCVKLAILTIVLPLPDLQFSRAYVSDRSSHARLAILKGLCFRPF